MFCNNICIIIITFVAAIISIIFIMYYQGTEITAKLFSSLTVFLYSDG